jgi:Concanavalin A-like lectin/glucanases superfamily/Secretion system C-terminal sorting domain
MKKLLLITFVTVILSNASAQVNNTDLLANYKFEQNTNASNNAALDGIVNGTVTYGSKNGSAINIANTAGSSECSGTWISQCLGYSKGKCIQWQQVCTGGLVTVPASNNYVSLPISNTAISDQFTISFWLNPQNSPFTWNNIICKRLNKAVGKTILYNSINVSILNSTTLYAGVTTTSGAEVNLTTPITVDEWTYITYTYDGSNVKLYKNGVLETESSTTGNVEFNTSTKWVLGQISDLDNSQGGNFILDDLNIFARALTVEETNTLKNGEITAIEDEISSPKYLISPNPANDFVNLSAQGEIYDLFGNKVAEGVGNISIANLSTGIYLVKIGSFTYKLIKN